jgi:hypothetical protein
MDLRQALEIIESGIWCSIRFITSDILKGNGGKVIEFQKCRLARSQNPSIKNVTNSNNEKVSRNPNHALHFTRNVEHPILITHLNQQAVI